MDSDQTLARSLEARNFKGDQNGRTTAQEICCLLDQAIARLAKPESSENRKILERFRDRISLGDMEGLPSLASVASDVQFYQTAHDGLRWAEDALACQLYESNDHDFATRTWADQLLERIQEHVQRTPPHQEL